MNIYIRGLLITRFEFFTACEDHFLAIEDFCRGRDEFFLCWNPSRIVMSPMTTRFGILGKIFQ